MLVHKLQSILHVKTADDIANMLLCTLKIVQAH